MVSQFLRREKLNESELLTNFSKLTQAWAGPRRDITMAPREAAAAAAACHACVYSVLRGNDRLFGSAGWPFALNVAVWALEAGATRSRQDHLTHSGQTLYTSNDRPSAHIGASLSAQWFSTCGS